MANRVSYTKKTWANHIVSYPRRYEETTQDGFIKHTPKFGTVIQQGTPIKAEFMNNIENGVKNCADAINLLGEQVDGIDENIRGKQDALTFDDTPTAESDNPVTSGGIKTALDTKQGTLTFDDTPTAGSDNPVKSKGIKSALDTKQDTLTFDETPKANSNNPVKSKGIKTALDGKQDALTFDSTPTANSSNPVTSGGVKAALDTKQATLTFDDSPTSGSDNPVKSKGIKTALDGKQDALTFDSTPTANSTNPVTSGGVKAALDSKVASFTAAIPSTGWTSQDSGAYYTITLTVSGILASDTPDIGIVQTGTWATDAAMRDAWACVTRIVATANELQVTASDIPGVEIPIQVRCIR